MPWPTFANRFAIALCALAAVALSWMAAQAQGKRSSFDGTWSVTRSLAERCGPRGATFNITIKGGSVSAPGGRGSISD